MPRTFGISNVAPYAAAPAVGNAGDTYWNTTNKTLYVSDGSAWNPWPTGTGGPPSGAAGGDLSGTYPNPTVAAGVPAATASALMRRDASGRSQVTDPSVAADIATKGYVDGLFAVQAMQSQATTNIGNAAWSSPITGWLQMQSPVNTIGGISGGQVVVKTALAGAYLLLTATVTFAAATTGGQRRSIRFEVNGASIGSNEGAASLTNIPFSVSLTTVYGPCVGGETIDVSVYHNQGGTVALQPMYASYGHLFHLIRVA